MDTPSKDTAVFLKDVYKVFPGEEKDSCTLALNKVSLEIKENTQKLCLEALPNLSINQFQKLSIILRNEDSYNRQVIVWNSILIR